MPTTLARPADAEVRSPLAWLITAYVAMIFIGSGVLLAPWAMRPGNGLSAGRAFFAAANAVCLTGFPSTSVRPIDMAPLGQWTLLVLTLLALILTLSATGKAIARASRYDLSLRSLFVASTLVALLTGLVGSMLLAGPADSLFDSTLNALATLGNSALHSASTPGATDWRTHAVLLPLSLLGSIGIVAMVDLSHGRVSKLTRRMVTLVAGGYLVSLGLLLLAGWLAGSPIRVEAASVLAIDTRTLGLSIVEVRQLPRAVQWLLVPLMMVGGATGGTAGGLKLTTLVVLLGAIRPIFAGKTPARVAGIAGLWLVAYLLLFMGITFWLLASETEVTADQAPFLAASALSCVGLARDAISITGNGLYALSAAMIAGRILPLIVLWWSVKELTGEDLPTG